MPDTPGRKSRLSSEKSRGDRLAEELNHVWRSLTREKIVDFLKTMIWVAPLTILIWVWAEQQQQQTITGLTAPIEVKDTDPNHILDLVSPKEKLVTVDISGSQSAVDRVQERLRNVSEPLEIQIPTRPPDAQPYYVDAKTYLESNAVFAGVVVTNCNPSSLQVHVDRLDSRPAKVVPPTNVPGLKRIDPSMINVKIFGPSQLLQTLNDEGLLAAKIDLANDPILRQPGEHDEVTVRLLPPIQDDRLKLIPDSIKANLWVGEADVTEPVSDIPVFVEAPASLLNSVSKISYDSPLKRGETFRGPKQTLDAMAAGTIPVIAVVQLAPQDFNFQGAKPISFPNLPEGVAYVPPDGQATTIQVTVTPK